MPLTPHQHLINAIPNWLGNASQARRAQLKSLKPGAYRSDPGLTDADHLTLKALNSAAWAAQNPVDRSLEQLQNASDFARPKLQQAIKQRFNLDLDVDLTQIRLYIPATIPWFPVRSGAARTWTATLLEAALHNFEADEARADAHEASSTFMQGGVTLPAVVAKMSIQQFIQLCRELDIGGQYQTYLQAQLREPVASAVLRQNVAASHKAALKAAVCMARLSGDISSTFAQLVEGLADGIQGLRLDNIPWQAHDLSLMSATLTGVVVFAQDLYASRQVVPVVAYIPDDPEHPIKQYSSSAALMQDLTRKLRTHAYQQFFTRFIAHAERPYFFANLNQRLSSVTWNPHVPGSPLPSWRETPATRTHLQFAANAVRGDLLEHLYQQKLNKVLNDAADIAISTASADRTARWAKWDALKDIALSLVQIAAFIAAPFFPPLGALMLGYTAYQLLDETFEGIIDWAEGLKTEAFGHLMGLMETLVQLGLFAAGLPIAETLLRPALPAPLLQFIDALKPVERPDGQARLWHPDLTPYDQGALPADARPDDLGLYTKGPLRVVPLPQGNIAVNAVGGTRVLRAQHPRRSNAYQPLLSHNGEGTWHSELDRPLSWSDDQLLQRLGHRANPLPLETLKQLCSLSQIDSTHLRKLHLDDAPLPPLLNDEITRFTLDQDLQSFIDQMHSNDPRVQAQADIQTQLQLLTSYYLWPERTALRFFSEQGEILWQYTPEGRHPVVQVQASQLLDGKLLETLLSGLGEQDIKTMLDEPFGQPPQSLSARAGVLRKKLAGLAEEKRSSLFEARYRGRNVTQDPAVQALMDSQTGLPASIAGELLRSATPEELKAFENGRIPLRLRDLARWARQEVRVTRAYEGLYLKSADNPDTDRLVVHSLPRLPGWSRDLRLEVKNQAGVLHDSIGSESARLRKTLIIDENGQYAVHDAGDEHLFGFTDLYRAILQAVPDAERRALGLNIAEGDKLQQQLRSAALPRDDLRALLLKHPLNKPAYDAGTMRLPGGMDGYPAATSSPLEAQAQHLFPSFTGQQLQDLLHTFANLPEGAARTLARLHHEYTQLTYDLSAWVANTPRRAPHSLVNLSRIDYRNAKLQRQLWEWEIKRCWRRETDADHENPLPGSFKLVFKQPLPGDLPSLNVRLEHVSFLEFVGDDTTQGVPGFLQHFPALRHLAVRAINLGDIPPAILEMPGLTQLLLNDCNITLSPDSHAALGRMHNLQVLDLYRNPLGRAPSLQGLTQLKFLDLTETGISTFPNIALGIPTPDSVILRDNLISELPAALFELPLETAEAFDFSGNPLSSTTLERVKQYYQRTGEHWNVDAPAADIAMTQTLYPTFSTHDASRFVLGLPGDLAAGERALVQLQEEYRTLQNDLALWAVSQPAEHPVLGTPLEEQTAAIEQFKRAQFKQLLEQAWRREVEVDNNVDSSRLTHKLVFGAPIMGELPALRANFDHVTMISLDGDNLTTGVNAFLKSFSKLSELNIQQAVLGDIPDAVFTMRKLRTLTLSRCDLRPSEGSLQALAGMDKLTYLNVLGNPQLTRAPDLSQMPELGVFSAYKCALSELPTGLLSRTRLVLADLRKNRLTDIPDDFYDTPATISNKVFLYGNPFTADAVANIVRFAQGNAIDLLRPVTAAEMPLLPRWSEE
ncbi:dermonecrotic toxin domain-containing protein [Pseudomonas graminis]